MHYRKKLKRPWDTRSSHEHLDRVKRREAKEAWLYRNALRSPNLMNHDRCRHCEQDILWARTVNGRSIPLDPLLHSGATTIVVGYRAFKVASDPAKMGYDVHLETCQLKQRAAMPKRPPIPTPPPLPTAPTDRCVSPDDFPVLKSQLDGIRDLPEFRAWCLAHPRNSKMWCVREWIKTSLDPGSAPRPPVQVDASQP